MFNIFKNNKKEDKVDELEVKEEPPIIAEEKWIWVEGYKGTDENMKCRDFQYELNKEFTYDGETSLCYAGFHFCNELEDVFSYYRLDLYNRYFKVKALVKEKDYINMENTKGNFSYLSHGIAITDSKLVAKQIILLEELKYKDLKKYIISKFPMIENEEDYKKCINYDMFCEDKFLSKMKNLGFSNIFSQILCENLKDGNLLFKYLQQATAYKEENISKDLMIYLLEQYKNKLV